MEAMIPASHTYANLIAGSLDQGKKVVEAARNKDDEIRWPQKNTSNSL